MLTVVPLNLSRQNARQTHRRLILSEIILNGPVSRTDIARRTGLTAASVSRISRELIEADLVTEGDEVADDRPGRRFVALDVKADGAYVLGISMNVFQQYITLADLKNKTIAKRELALTSFEDVDTVVETLIDEVSRLIDKSRIPKNKIIGGSLGVTGAVEPSTGTICSAPLFGWENVPIGQLLSEPLDIPIHVESLANAINLAETRFGMARGHNNVIVFNASLGIGVSMLMDNRLIRGSDASVGLINDLSIWVDHEGMRPTVDQIAGGWGVLSNLHEGAEIRSSREAIPQTHKLFHILELADGGDERARAALAKSGYALGEVICAVNGIMHPELLIIAGPLAWCPHYVRGIRNAFTAAGFTGNQIPMQASDMTWRAATRWLAINEFLLQRDIDLETLAKRTVA